MMRVRLLWRKPWRPVAWQGSSLVLLLGLFACRAESARVERAATAAPPKAITALSSSGAASISKRPPDPPAQRKTKRVFQAVVSTGSGRVAETCAELDTGEVTCSLDGEHGCSIERLASGVQRVGQSLCALSSAGLPVSLDGVGCELSAGSNRLVESAFDNDDAACVREPDGTVYCVEKPQKARHRLLSRVQELSFGTGFFCGLRDNGEVWCWGRNEQGGLGDGRSHVSKVAVRVTLPKPARRLAVGNQHACAVLADDSVSCWGENTQGAVGVGKLPSPGDIPIPGSPNEYLVPQKVVGLPPVDSVMAAGNQTCALTRAGEIFCWGETWSGTLGQTAFVPNATLVSGLPTAVALTIGRPSCAVTVDGQAFCWGEGCPLLALQSQPLAVEWATNR
jgi:hypothetical protein